MPLSDEQMISILAPFRVRPTSEQILKVREYIRVLLQWNQSISMTSVEEPAEILARHFGESMYAACAISVEKGRLADLGSGAGFPGFPLKIIRPDLHLIAIESNRKKCAFLSEIVRALDLTDVEVVPKRYEDIRVSPGFAEFVSARAIGSLPQLLHWAKGALSNRGHALLWVGAEDSTKLSRAPDWIWQPVVRIPESKGRFLLIGRPNPSRSD